MTELKAENLKSTLYQVVKKSIENNNESELFFKAFLKPMEIALKTGLTEKNPEKVDSMPYGLKQVLRTSASDNKFILQNFQSFDDKFDPKVKEISFDKAKQYRCNNLVSLMKPSQKSPKSEGIKVAICICMYSEDKSMLKRTLTGVSQNIEKFVRCGYTYDDIGVFVVMDGIEVVDETVDTFFEELEKDHNIYLGNDVEPARSDQMLQENREVEDEEVDNINHLIFSPEEHQQFKSMRFIERKRQYKQHKQMIKSIEVQERDKNITFDSLDSITQRFYLQKAREQYKKDYAASDDDVKNVQDQRLIDEYAQSKKTSSPLIKAALTESKKFCQEYITSRDNMALMSTFRVTIDLLQYKEKEDEQNGRKNNYYALETQSSQSKSTISMNLFFVTKYKNRGKLTSHNWFFNGFCVQLKPKYAILLDVGLVPEKDALVKMCSYMDRPENQLVGGVCGYMGLRIERLEDNEQINDEQIDCVTSLSLRLFDIQRAQQFEYHFAHLIDKPFESCFKFIHVLPGAFSGYRMKALRNDDQNESKILREYFKSIEAGANTNYKAEQYSFMKTLCKVILPDFLFFCIYNKPSEDSYEKLLYDENVYLAEDRTLCMGIHQNGFALSYLPDAGAWVDPMKTLYGMLGQRKRWINGSYFAFEKVKEALSESEGEFCLKTQIRYLTFMGWLGFVSPALFMYTIHIAMYTFQTNVILSILQQLGLVTTSADITTNNVMGIFVYLIDFIYVLIFLGLVFFSMHLTNREPKFRTFFYGVSTLYGVLSFSVFGVLLYDIISGFGSNKNTFLITNPWLVSAIAGGQAMINSIRYIMLSIILLYVIPVIVSLKFGKFQYIVDILFSTFSFIFFNPTYLNILNIYALCRMDDISWGTKGLNTDGAGRKKEMVDDWRKIKILHVSKFVFYNLIVGFLLLLFGDQYAVRFWLTFVIMILLTITLLVKVLASFCYLICYPRTSTQESLQQNTQRIIWGKFCRIKQSMYNEIQRLTSEMESEMNTIQLETSLAGAILMSKIHNLKPNRKYKKNTNQVWDNLNNTHRKEVVMMFQNSMKPKKKDTPGMQIIVEEGDQNTTSEKFSEQELSTEKGKTLSEEVVIITDIKKKDLKPLKGKKPSYL